MVKAVRAVVSGTRLCFVMVTRLIGHHFKHWFTVYKTLQQVTRLGMSLDGFEMNEVMDPSSDP